VTLASLFTGHPCAISSKLVLLLFFVDMDHYTPEPTFNRVTSDPEIPVHGVYVEDVDMEENGQDQNDDSHIEMFPNVAEALGVDKTFFQDLREAHAAENVEPWYPFDSVEEWKLARWLIDNVTQGAIKEFLELSIVSTLCLFLITDSLPSL
jgi:hypothetical protein